MKNKLIITFTKSNWSLFSWLIRWALPRSRFSFALSSHSYVTIGDYTYEADFGEGVHKVDRYNPGKITKKLTTVKEVVYDLPNPQKAIEFLEAQVGKGYDLGGALGVGINPNREWDNDNKWFCYELAAASLVAGGFIDFSDMSHITETALLAISGKPL